jgi:hypothetical protein
MGRLTPEREYALSKPNTGYRFRGREIPIRERGNGSVKTKTGETKL